MGSPDLITLEENRLAVTLLTLEKTLDELLTMAEDTNEQPR